jgi:hypothetical protein
MIGPVSATAAADPLASVDEPGSPPAGFFLPPSLSQPVPSKIPKSPTTSKEVTRHSLQPRRFTAFLIAIAIADAPDAVNPGTTPNRPESHGTARAAAGYQPGFLSPRARIAISSSSSSCQIAFWVSLVEGLGFRKATSTEAAHHGFTSSAPISRRDPCGRTSPSMSTSSVAAGFAASLATDVPLRWKLFAAGSTNPGSTLRFPVPATVSGPMSEYVQLQFAPATCVSMPVP